MNLGVKSDGGIVENCREENGFRFDQNTFCYHAGSLHI